MEDRSVPGLWLEMCDRAADTYADHRVPDVLALDGVARTIWFVNVCRDRTDLPRELPEFDTLGIYEVDGDFAPPEPPPDITGLHLRRTARPAQGRLTGRPTTGISLVLISPRAPGQAQALRDWGDFTHISQIAAAGVPAMTMITPFEHATGGDPRFCHLYEMDGDDPEATFQAMTPLVTERLGGRDSAAWRTWATCPELRIMYVNSFRAVGRREAGAPEAGTA